MATQTLQPIRTRHKFKEATQVLRKLAHKVGANGKLPTVRELCKSLQISSATLDDVLYDLELKGVLQRKHGSGLYVSPRIDQKNVGLVFGRNIFEMGSSPFYSLLIKGCEERAVSHHEKFSFFLDLPSPLDEEGALPVHQDLAEAIESGRLHGILLAARKNEAQETWLRSQEQPVVSFDIAMRYPHGVAIDYNKLVQMGVDALVQQGCQRIALITPLGCYRFENTIRIDDDLRGFAKAMKRHGLPDRPQWVWELRRRPEETTPMQEALGFRAVKELFAAGKTIRPDGLVIADDMMTRGALTALGELGLSVGRDVKIATHANRGSPLLREHEAVLTLMEIDTAEIVDAMFEMLDRLMHARKNVEEHIYVSPKMRTSSSVV